MKKSFYLSLILTFSFTIIFAQKSVNSYKYVLVPKYYEFLKAPDQYQLNSLTKFLFDKAGFTTLFNDEVYPQELAANSCLALKVVVDKSPGMFTTKLRISMLDCHNIVVYSTQEGRSKEKQYKKAYHEALRRAFEEIKELNYSYDGSLNNVTGDVVVKDGQIQIVSKEVELTDEMIDILAEALLEKEAEVPEKIEVQKVSEKEPEPAAPLKEKEVQQKEIKGAVVEKKEATAVAKEIEPVAEVRVREVAKKEERTAIKETPPVENVQDELKISVAKTVNIKSLEGKFVMGNWGTCTISKKENVFSVVGGDENFEFATIYKSSKPAIYIIKWVAYKQPQLLELDKNGNLRVDTDSGVKTYERTN